MLKTFVASMRNWNIERPLRGTSRKMPRSTFSIAGASTMLRPELPLGSEGGVGKCSNVEPASIQFISRAAAIEDALPTRSARSLVRPSRLRSWPAPR